MSDLVQVEITSTAITARYGTLTPGDILRTDPAFAKHLVEDCAAAKYRNTPADSEATPAPVKAARQRKSAEHPVSAVE